jgi:transcriptional regulator with XRE-family HTH domain
MPDPRALPLSPARPPDGAPAAERRVAPRFGVRVRALRLRAGLTQAGLARQLGVSASYLNLIERDRRPLPSDLLVRLAQALDVDLRSFAADDDARLVGDLAEVFGDAVFEQYPLTRQQLADFVGASPGVARAVVALHQAYAAARANAEALAERSLDLQDAPDGAGAAPGAAPGGALDHSRLSTEQVSDLLQRHGNHFPALEAAAERLRRDAGLGAVGMFGGLARHLERAHGVAVRIATVREMRGATRRYDPARRELLLSEVLHRGSRNFQAASQIALLAEGAALDALAADAPLGGADARALARVALAGYYAAAVLMPYEDFLAAAEETRYDVELLGHRFRVGWEQTCHRLTTLGRPGREGVGFYMVRVDLAGTSARSSARRDPLPALQRAVRPVERARRLPAARRGAGAALAAARRHGGVRRGPHRATARRRLPRAHGAALGGDRVRPRERAAARVRRRGRPRQPGGGVPIGSPAGCASASTARRGRSRRCTRRCGWTSTCGG